MNQRRVPISGIGRPTPPEHEPQTIVQQMLAGVQMGGDTGPTLDPGAFEGAPPWVAYLANLCQNMRVEVASFKLALIRRGLLTEAEFAEALLTVTRAYEQEFLSQMGNLERQMNQAGPPAAPINPRRSPT